MTPLGFEVPLLAVGGVSLGLIGGALALGFRHGIDWDHIAAITDITSTSASTPTARETVLMTEPGVQLTDESDHSINPGGPVHSHGLGRHEHATDEIPASARVPSSLREERPLVMASAVGSSAGAMTMPLAARGSAASKSYVRLVGSQGRPWMLGTLYALGHGTVVTILGLLAILVAGVLPSWVDPVMERVVGVTLVVLSVYLFYSVYKFFRGGEEFRLRSRWMLVFAGIRNGWSWLRGKVNGQHEHRHVHAADQYGWKTAYGIGMIHGVGAETGTQALIIATAAGASTKGTSVLVLLTFVLGLLISNSVVTVMSTTGFVSAHRRQSIYVAAGLIAAVFSLVIGIIFLAQAGDQLPDLGQYFEWIGGPD
jgi:high-affinity nickel-transport protein